MTVCIAAVLYSPGAVTATLVSDHLISGEYISADGAMKYSMLDGYRRWAALCTAVDTKRVEPLFAAIRDRLGTNIIATTEAVADACTAAYKSQLETAVNARLRSRGLTLKGILADGQAKLGDAYFDKVMEEIKSVDLGVSLLVAGFDEHNHAQLLEVSTSGEVLVPPMGFHAIGTGGWVAEAVLYQLSPGWWTSGDLAENIYRLCCAKFAAERDPHVGPATTVITIALTREDPFGDVSFMFSDEVEPLRSIWARGLMASPPKRALDLIKRDLASFHERAEVIRAARPKQ